MEHQIAELKRALGVVQSIVDGIAERLLALQTQKHAMAITPDVPEGWDTVLGYLAKYHPDVLDAFDYSNPSATARDGWWLKHQCMKRGIETPRVPAPPCLRACGIDHVNAYPVTLLAHRWG